MEKVSPENSKKEEIVLDEKKEKIIYIVIGVVFVVLIVAFFFSIPKPYDESNLQNNTVVRVIDGDTFQYYDQNSNKVLTVRLLCVNTPEKGKDGYDEATSYLRSLIMSKEVILNASVTDKDKYGRSLRYVYVNDMGTIEFVNKMVLDNGYGVSMIIPPETCDKMK
jgi:micrococcal nuclease